MKKVICLTAILFFSAGSIAQAQQPNCIATTQKGSQCTRKATVGSYCRQHDPQAIRCTGTTKAGNRCKLLPMKGCSRCKVHFH